MNQQMSSPCTYWDIAAGNTFEAALFAFRVYCVLFYLLSFRLRIISVCVLMRFFYEVRVKHPLSKSWHMSQDNIKIHTYFVSRLGRFKHVKGHLENLLLCDCTVTAMNV